MTYWAAEHWFAVRHANPDRTAAEFRVLPREMWRVIDAVKSPLTTRAGHVMSVCECVVQKSKGVYGPPEAGEEE